MGGVLFVGVFWVFFFFLTSVVEVDYNHLKRDGLWLIKLLQVLLFLPTFSIALDASESQTRETCF